MEKELDLYLTDVAQHLVRITKAVESSQESLSAMESRQHAAHVLQADLLRQLHQQATAQTEQTALAIKWGAVAVGAWSVLLCIIAKG